MKHQNHMRCGGECVHTKRNRAARFAHAVIVLAIAGTFAALLVGVYGLPEVQSRTCGAADHASCRWK